MLTNSLRRATSCPFVFHHLARSISPKRATTSRSFSRRSRSITGRVMLSDEILSENPVPNIRNNETPTRIAIPQC